VGNLTFLPGQDGKFEPEVPTEVSNLFCPAHKAHGCLKWTKGKDLTFMSECISKGMYEKYM